MAGIGELDRDGGEMRGAIWILFLEPDGSLKGKRKISDWKGGFTGLLRDESGFGRSLAAPGDLDGDGVEDILVSSEDGVWTLFLDPDGTVCQHHLTRMAEGKEAFLGASIACSTRWKSGGLPLMAGGHVGSRESRDRVFWRLAVDRDGALRPR